MVKTNFQGEDITKVRRQQFEVSSSRNAREITLVTTDDSDQD